MRLATIGVVLTVLLSASAPAAERFALPEFKSGYVRPITQTPLPRADAYEVADLAVLAAALVLASYLALKVRSRRWLWVLMAGSLAYFGLWRGGCVCPIGAIQNVSLGLLGTGYAVPLVVIGFFLLPLVTALVAGRTFCAAVCPLGAIQDLVAVRPVRVPRWIDHALGLLAYVYLGAAVLLAATGALFLICEYDPFVSFFRLLPLARPAATMEALGGSKGKLVLGLCFLAAGLVIARPYCRWLCPYGAILRLLSRASKWHVSITPDECIRCTLCKDSCPFNAIQSPTTDPPPTDRPIDRRRLALLLVLAAALLAAGGVFGASLGGPFSKAHYTVQVADRVRMEETGQVEGTVDMSEAFYATRRSREDLYADAAAVRAGFVRGGTWLGLWVGLVVGVKLIHLSIRRTRTDFTPDRATCLSCGRCFAYCPVERQRLKKLEGTPAPT